MEAVRADAEMMAGAGEEVVAEGMARMTRCSGEAAKVTAGNTYQVVGVRTKAAMTAAIEAKGLKGVEGRHEHRRPHHPSLARNPLPSAIGQELPQ